MDLIDMTGQRFGMLTVIERAPDKVLPSGRRATMWRCKCDCGGEKIADGSSLRRGETKTCGCWKKPKNIYGGDWIKMPKPIMIQNELVVSETYMIKGKLIKLIGIYDEFARFEDEFGFHYCYRFWDLERELKQ